MKSRTIERVAYATGALLFLSGLGHAVVLIASGGSWTGPVSMRKAVTFGLSFGLTLITVAWATSYVAVRPRVRNVLLGVFTGASVVETLLVSMQAWRGVPSHFNFETGFDNAVSTTLAAGGGVIILTAVSFMGAALRGDGETSASMRLAVRFGLVALLVALGAGAAMIASGVAEARGGNPQAAYTTAGALKPLHAVAMHAILIVPGLAWLLRFAEWMERRRVRLVWVAIGAYSVLTAVVGLESVAGVSPLAASPVEMVTSGVALGVLGLIGAVAVREAVRRRSRVS
ncbi:hypothetical protein NQK81_33685 [Amycolatopsis roodepoortensis]|uniref:hypothetical protein n=1 Tax=Amycolatopsis roodepoortensis TaxID=700274 RepID=UPI00214B4D73|nr:hypothetical protein [Amycolatopsis roodepoortensis]UUV29682.1 hypothetical protein NQK81_33685 [Amycolatopsis roodepoortensis]